MGICYFEKKKQPDNKTNESNLIKINEDKEKEEEKDREKYKEEEKEEEKDKEEEKEEEKDKEKEEEEEEDKDIEKDKEKYIQKDIEKEKKEDKHKEKDIEKDKEEVKGKDKEEVKGKDKEIILKSRKIIPEEKYCKLSEIIDNPILFPQEFKPEHFHQGNIGNCFFISTMEAISKFPEIIRSLFKNPKNFNPSADYFEIIYGNPKKKKKIENKFEYEIDRDGKKVLKYSKPYENACFLVILEKFYAEELGGYEELNKGGYEIDVFKKILGILGITVKEFDKENISKNDILDKIKNAEINDGALITTGKYYSETVAHAYVIKGVYSIYDKRTNRNIDCIVVKNPHCEGNFEQEKININKIQSLLSGLEYIKKINNDYPKTGIIYMPIDYYQKWFDEFTVCTVNYKILFPETYKHFHLYKRIMELYNMNSSKYYFDVDDGGQLIKTNLIPYGDENSKVLINKDIGLNEYTIYSDNLEYDMKINGYNEKVELSDFFGKKLEANYVISKENGKYEVLTLDEILKKKRLNPDDIYRVNMLIDELIQSDHKYIKRTLTLEKLTKEIEESNKEEWFKIFLEKLKEKDEKIKKANDNMIIMKEDEEYNKLLNFLQQTYPEKHEHLAKIKAEHIKLIRIPDSSAVPSDKPTIFEGLNLISEEICNDNYTHNYHAGYVREIILNNYLDKEYNCVIKNCGKGFIFNKYFSLFRCYFSINEEPEKSTGDMYNVANYIISKETKITTITTRPFEKFNFYSSKYEPFSINFPKSNTVLAFKQFLESSYKIKILSLYGFRQYSQIPKLMNDDDTFNCIEGNEINVELYENLSILNLDNSLTHGITNFKANYVILD